MWVRGRVCAWIVLCALQFCDARADGGNPFEQDENAIKTGAALFAARCADCHGPDAKGNRGPDLTRVWLAGGSDDRVFAIIRNGVEGSIMPPSAAPDTELWAIVAHLRSISTVPPFAASGDATRGRALFEAHCAECHRVGAAGGTLGPELTRIAEMRSREAVELAIRDPNASIPLGFRAVTLVTRRGERIEGVVKNEDAFSIQVATVDERLRSFRKADLSELARATESLMPIYGPERLSEAELEDLVAYLGTLRSPAARRVASTAVPATGAKP
jgi:putative heme-binding domain-containing protein